MFLRSDKKTKMFLIVLISVMLIISSLIFGFFYVQKDKMVSVSAVHSQEEFINFENAVMGLIKNSPKQQLNNNDKLSTGNDTYSINKLSQDDNGKNADISGENGQFQLKRLIVKGELKDSFGANGVYSYNGLHILSFNTEEETEYAYNQLIKDVNLNVVIDKYYTVESYADNEYSYTTGYKNWGAKAAEIGGYRQFLTDNSVSKQAVVVVMDTGLNTSHEMFADRMLTDSNGKIVGYSYYNSYYQYSYENLSFEENDTEKNSFEDDNGHGSHVAGIICDLTPKNVKILPIKIGDPENDNGSTGTTMLLAYLRVINVYSSQYNIVCTNLSYTGAGKESESDRDTFNAYCYEPLKKLNILPVTAAGNSSTEYDIEGLEAVVVSALKQNGKGYLFDDSYSNYGKFVDISAPGSGIYSAWINSTNGAGAQVYRYADGTSMASPQVAGIVALLYLNPNLQSGYTANTIEQMLYDTSIDLGSPGKDALYGNGMINLRYFEVSETQTLSFYKNQEFIEDYADYELFEESFDLGIQCSDSSFKIIYTTDESIPNINKSTTYLSEINVSETIFIYAMGVKIENGQITERTKLYNISYFYLLTPIEECFVINSSGAITGYTGKFLDIEVPEYISGIKVKSLSSSLFRKSRLERITLPESCVLIGGYVFQSCENLKYVYAPGVSQLYIAAFNASGITFVTDETPASGATEGCYFPALKSTISWTFASCQNLQSVKLSKLVLNSEEDGYDFAGCINLTEVSLPSLTAIPNYTFYMCEKLQTFTISKDVASIGDFAFAYNKLNSINVEQGNKYFYGDGKAVYSNNTILVFACGVQGDYTVRSSVSIDGTNSIITKLGAYVMLECNINNLTIPQSITAIDKAFMIYSKVNNLYYNGLCSSSSLYFQNGYIAAPFNRTVINNLYIGENVTILSERLFQESLPKNIYINSINTTFASACFYIFDRDTGAACPFDIYLQFNQAVTTTWLSQLQAAQVNSNLSTLRSKVELPSSYASYLSKLSYVGVDNNGYYVYSRSGFTINATCVGNGSISPNGAVAVFKGQSVTFIITPDIGHKVKDVLVNGVSVGAVRTYTFSNVSANQTIVAEFEENPIIYYTISVSCNDGGTITPNSDVTIQEGMSQTFSISALEGYKISDVVIDGLSKGPINTYTFNNVKADHTISVLFEKLTYTITASSGSNGSISPKGSIVVEYGKTQKFNFIPDKGYKVKNIKIDGVQLASAHLQSAISNGYTFDNVKKNYTISVDFEILTYVIKASTSNANATITPSGENVYNYGSDQTYIVNVNTGYKITSIVVDDTALSEDEIFVVLEKGYVFENIENDHTIYVEVVAIPYIITYNLNYDGAINITQTYNYADEIELPEQPIREGYDFAGWYKDVEFLNVFDLTAMPESDLTVYAKWDIKIYVITATAGENGKITPKGESGVKYGGFIKYEFQPNFGYHISSISVDGVTLSEEELTHAINKGYTFNDVKNHHTIGVNFDINKYRVTFTVEGPGEFNTDQQLTDVTHGEDRLFTINTDTTKYKAKIYVNGELADYDEDQFLLENINQNTNIKVEFVDKSFFVTEEGIKTIFIATSGAVLLYGIFMIIRKIRKG